MTPTELAESQAPELDMTQIEEAKAAAYAELASLSESIAELELALEDVGWIHMALMGELEFSRDGLRRINDLARLMYLKNPLIQRGVNVQAFYVFGQGVAIAAKHPDVNEVIQGFLDDEKNKAELTSHQARLGKEVELQLFSNLFFCFFTNARTGRVRIRTIPVAEIVDIHTNPDDKKEPWYYKRVWMQTELDTASGIAMSTSKTAYYPDWHYKPEKAKRPREIGGNPVEWDSPVYHVKTGGLPDMLFGVSEVYAAIDWARAYKEFLENWSSLVKAYARFAWRGKAKTAAGAAAMKAKLGTTLGGQGTSETNPPPVAASAAFMTEGMDLQPIRTAGATTSADDARRLLLMVAAATGLPETFFGDTQVGALATAKSLDRPTELKMVSRQTLWRDILSGICSYVILQAVKANRLTGTVVEDEEDHTESVELPIDPGTGAPIDATVDVNFPPILEHDVGAVVDAIIKAATLDGKAPAGTIPDTETLARMLLTALGEPDVDGMVAHLFPEDEQATEAEGELAVAAVKLREAIEAFADARVA